MTDITYVEITRSWKVADYETYRVTIKVPVTGSGDGAILTAARYAAKNAHLAWGEYKAEYINMKQDGGDFDTAKSPYGKGRGPDLFGGPDLPDPTNLAPPSNPESKAFETGRKERTATARQLQAIEDLSKEGAMKDVVMNFMAQEKVETLHNLPQSKAGELIGLLNRAGRQPAEA